MRDSPARVRPRSQRIADMTRHGTVGLQRQRRTPLRWPSGCGFLSFSSLSLSFPQPPSLPRSATVHYHVTKETLENNSPHQRLEGYGCRFVAVFAAKVSSSNPIDLLVNAIVFAPGRARPHLMSTNKRGSPDIRMSLACFRAAQ